MTEQQALFGIEVRGVDRDHALVRFTDPETSHEADAQLRRREGGANVICKGTHRHRALLAFDRAPRTADEVKMILGIEGIWKRVSDLKNMGFIQPTGHTRMSRAGRDQEVLEITVRGLEALRDLG